MKVALLGAGRIGQLHARLLSATPGVDDLIVADALPDRAAEVASQVGARTAPSLEAALDAAEAVVIAALAALKRPRKHYQWYYSTRPANNDMRHCPQGVPAFLRAYFHMKSADWPGNQPFRLAGHDPAPPHESYIPQSGGLFRDFSIHDFDILRWVTGSEVDEVYADGGIRGFPVFAKYSDVDTAVAALRMVDGALGVMTVARHDPLGYDIRAELFGSRDSVSVGLGPKTPMRSVEPGVPPPAGPAWPHCRSPWRFY